MKMNKLETRRAKKVQRSKDEAKRLRESILALYENGLRPQQIRERLNISRSCYDYHAQQIRSTGKMLVRHRLLTKHSVKYKALKSGLNLGAISDVFSCTTNEFFDWACVRTERGGYKNMGEWLRDELLDVWESEKGRDDHET